MPSVSRSQDSERSPSAVIWISGLGAQGVNENLTEVAQRIAFACDRCDVPEATYAFRSTTSPDVVSSSLSVPRATVLRTDAAGTRPVLDLYGLSTAATLVGDRSERGLLSRIVFAGRTLYRMAPRVWRTRQDAEGKKRTARTGAGKTKVERHQLNYASAWLIVMVLGFVVLLGGLATTFVAGDLPTALKILEAPILFLGGLGIWKSTVAKRVGSAALIGYSVVDYLDRGEDNGSRLRGQLAVLLEYLAEHKDRPKNIDVLAYSFGSIVAIDALFPYVQSPPPRFATINRLVTIACPFDFVRSYWPEYFTRRFSLPNTPPRWTNFYAPSDVLASNFRDDDSVDEASAKVEVRPDTPVPSSPDNEPYYIDGRDVPVSGWDSVLLKGLRFHAQYWSSRVASEESVFDQVVSHLGKSDS